MMHPECALAGPLSIHVKSGVPLFSKKYCFQLVFQQKRETSTARSRLNISTPLPSDSPLLQLIAGRFLNQQYTPYAKA